MLVVMHTYQECLCSFYYYWQYSVLKCIVTTCLKLDVQIFTLVNWCQSNRYASPKIMQFDGPNVTDIIKRRSKLLLNTVVK